MTQATDRVLSLSIEMCHSVTRTEWDPRLNGSVADRLIFSESEEAERTAWRIMVKLVYCITKKAGLKDEDFFRYWENVHGPLGARIPRLRRLVQSHRLTVPGDRYRPDYDGMAELWFDDLEALLAARQSAEWKASSEDEANFIDHSKVAYFISEEHIVLDKTEPGVSLGR